MKFSLLPKNENFFELFEKAVDNLVEGMKLFKDMVENYENVEEKAKKIKQIEHEGDLITHEIVERLNRTFVTPFEREDIHALTSGLDDVLDSIEALANRMVMFKIEKPNHIVVELANILMRATEEIKKAIHSLRKLEHLMTFCVEIKGLESKTDDITRQALADLFDSEKDPIALIKWREIYGRLEATADECEDVANIIEAVVVKNA